MTKIKKDDVKIGSKYEKMWTDIRDNQLKALENTKNELLVLEEYILLAERKIAEEKEKFK